MQRNISVTYYRKKQNKAKKYRTKREQMSDLMDKDFTIAIKNVF